MGNPTDPRSRTGRAIVLATLATAGGYGLTLIQQVVFARSMGISVETDSLATALAWGIGTSGPVGTALASIVLPAYVGALARQDHALARQVLRASTGIGLVAATVLMIISIVGADLLANLLAPGLTQTAHERLAGLLRISAPLQMLWIGVWLTTARANARERYSLAAGSFAIPPIPVILTFTLIGSPSIEQVALAYMLGAALQVLVVSGRIGSLGELGPSFRTRTVLDLARRLVPVGAAFGVLSVFGLAIRSVASLYGPGAVATSDYASRLVIAGEQVLLSGLLSVLFTKWSHLEGSLEAVTQAKTPSSRGRWSVQDSVLQLLGAGTILACLLVITARPAVAILFQGGRFDAAATIAVADFIVWMSPGIAGNMLVLLAARALLVSGRFIILLEIGAIAIIAMLGVGLVAGSSLGLNSVALGYSVGWVAAAGVAIRALEVDQALFVRQLVRALATGGAALGSTLVVRAVLPDASAIACVLTALLFVGVAGLVGWRLDLTFARDVIGALARLRSTKTRAATGSRLS
ncbi:MAG: hypothetical protein EPO00_12495 [Chloroflexota bacterium]|nr:MAG: hypothetical protein EPO00_12495 [Chloroflexota bacterium]